MNKPETAQMIKSGELLRQAAAQLQQAGCDSPRLDAELLLMKVWQISRTDIFVKTHDEVPQDIVAAFDELLTRRLRREPLAYITGEKEFWSRCFLVNPDVLIPRPETEHLQPSGYIIFETGLCGLPNIVSDLQLEQAILDLSGHKRGGVFHLHSLPDRKN